MPRNFPAHSIGFPDSARQRGTSSAGGPGLSMPLLLLATIGVGATLLNDSSGGGAGGALVNLVDTVSNLFSSFTSSIWSVAISLADSIIAGINDSFMHNSGGLSALFPESGEWIASALAMTLCGLMLLGISGPMYAAWKSWRNDRAQHLN
jgi:hypothetical protein